MNKNNVLKFLAIIVIIAVLVYLAVFGLTIGGKKIVKSAKDIKTGLDISGGVSLVYQARAEEGKEITQEDLKKSEAVMRKRLDSKNIFDSVIRSDSSTNQIYIEIPAKINDDSKEPLEAVEGLDKTAKVQFKDPDGKVLLEGDDIKTAKYSENPVDNTGIPTPHVELTFSDEGAKKFAEATEKLIGKKLSIFLDTELITDPYVNQKITSNTAIITMGDGTFSEKKQKATEYSLLISSGALPFNLDVISKEYVGPYSGQKALEISIVAGMVALGCVAIFMILIYRLPGVVATIALIAYVAIVLLIMSMFGITFTLPGIAGLVLSIGMAVDANVIIFERLKDELKQNVGANKAYERSFKRAMSAIIDGNITTFIVAILLYIFGIGPIKGFGIVLAIGVVISLFTAVVVTRLLLKQFINIANKNTFLFGVKVKKEGI